jgi:hypothetical protein
MHDINEKIINLRDIVLFSFFDFCVLLYRLLCLSALIYLSIYRSFYLKQQITTTIFFRRRSRHRLRHCRRTTTSNRRCTLEWCSVITVHGCWALSYLLPLFFSACMRSHTLAFFRSVILGLCL